MIQDFLYKMDKQVPAFTDSSSNTIKMKKMLEK